MRSEKILKGAEFYFTPPALARAASAKAILSQIIW
jgi:hypothetical protein